MNIALTLFIIALLAVAGCSSGVVPEDNLPLIGDDVVPALAEESLDTSFLDDIESDLDLLTVP
jgi:hypothetical protein